jgi:hypothetical protein
MTSETEPIRSKERERQITSTIYMVAPDHFGFNPQTASTNSFQTRIDSDQKEIQERAFAEFKSMVFTLQSQEINVVIGHNAPGRITPDEVFPNNWFSTHEDGTLILYPMFAQNRRLERMADPDFLKKLKEQGKFHPKEIKDFAKFEQSGQCLEGTGSLILDRKNKIAYTSQSPRTSLVALQEFSETMNYDSVPFHATRLDGKEVYHTNVVLSVGDGFAVICPDVIRKPGEKNRVLRSLAQNHEVIEITEEQMDKYCANILQLDTPSGKPIIVMSDTAYDGFESEQRNKLEKYGKLVPVHIPTIEQVGGGSARCMIAEIFPSR